MSESTETAPAPYDFSTDPDNVTKDDVVANDFIFHLITSTILSDEDSNSGSLAITLTIDGNVVSGLAIGANQWLAGINDQLVAGNEVVGRAFADSFELIKQTKSETKARREAEGRPAIVPRFIYMKDVTINPGSNPVRLPFWKVYASAISGWALGSVEYSSE